MFGKFDKLKQERTKYINDIKQNEDKLYGGTYRLLFEEGRCFWIKEKSFCKWLSNLINLKVSNKKKIRYFMLSKKYKVMDNNNAVGEKLYVTRKGNVKVFDMQNDKVIYYCNNNKLVNKAKEFSDNYAKFFGTNVILECNTEQRYIVERFVTEADIWRENKDELKSMSIWLGKCLCNYAKGLTYRDIKYFSYETFVSEIYKNAEKEQEKVLLDRIIKVLNIQNEKIICINQHNDLVLSNILKEATGYTVFDYEFYGMNLFYYDFFLWFVWKAVYYRERQYFDEYMQGKMDSVVGDLFESVNSKFDEKRRKDYVYLFMLANINMHLAHKEGIDFRKYNEFLNYADKYVI